MKKIELSVLLGQNIVSLRKKLNITQRELSERVKLTTDSVMKIEKGRMAPKMGRLQDIADALQCSVSTLFIDENRADIDELTQSFAMKMKDLTHEDKEFVFEVLDSTINYVKKKS